MRFAFIYFEAKITMRFKPTVFAAAAACLLSATHASATLLTFEDLTEGVILSNQYSALGITFTPNAFTGTGGPVRSWATNTAMRITATDIGSVGTPSLVSGKMLRAYGNTYTSDSWLAENGDPSFLISFASQGATAISMDFASVATPANVRLFVYNGATLLSTVTSTATGQFTLSYTAPQITSVIVTPGSYNDWVAVDNVNFTLAAVPEPATYAMLLAGLGVVGLARRHSRMQ